jgi:GNAT superfamily N-acetyltransferase
VEVRLARPEDTAAVADVYVGSFATLTFLPRLHTDEETRAWIADVVMANQEVWVAELEGSVVGMASLSDGVLEQFYVAPDAQSHGVGTALLEKAKERRPAGFTFWVFQQNHSARRFYERRGCRLLELTDGSHNEERTPDALYEWRPP